MGGCTWGRRRAGALHSFQRRGGRMFSGIMPRCNVVFLTFVHTKISCVCVCVHVHLCPGHLTSLNSNNVFPHINMLWISAHIIDPPAQPHCCPWSTPFSCSLLACCCCCCCLPSFLPISDLLIRHKLLAFSSPLLPVFLNDTLPHSDFD